MAMFLRVLLAGLAVACVQASRSEGQAQLHRGAGQQQDVQGNQESEIHEHLSQKSGSEDEESMPACCKCKSHQHKYRDSSGSAPKTARCFSMAIVKVEARSSGPAPLGSGRCWQYPYHPYEASHGVHGKWPLSD